jgi:DNA modification methylase
MTELTTEADAVRVFHGDSRDVLKGFPDDHFDSVVCDPPYALVSIVKRFGGANAAPAKGNDAYTRASAGFMSQTWDTGETAFSTEFWAEVMRVLKPGGHVIAFSGTRTYHRLAVAIEDAGFEIRDMVAWLYGSGFPKSHDVSKGIDKAAGAVRDKIRIDASQVRNPKATGAGRDGMVGATRPWIEEAMANGFHEKDGDEPATDAARQWQGWGTALKPSHEPCVLAVKPLTDRAEWVTVDRHLEAIEGALWSMLSASAAEALSASSPAALRPLASAQWTAADALNTSDVSSALTVTSPSEWATITSWNTVSSWRRTLAATSTLESTSTTGTGSSTTTDLKTLKSCLSKITPESITQAHSRGAWSIVDACPVVALFSACVASSRATLELFAIANAIEQEPRGCRVEVEPSAYSPNLDPVVLARKPLIGTVAANVLQHGTGALNIDASRIAHDEPIKVMAAQSGGDKVFGQGGRKAETTDLKANGRWPANVIHDGSEEVTGAFPDLGKSTGGGGVKTAIGLPGEQRRGHEYGETVGFGDSGSAARFFYSAKADAEDRLGSKHPTVKPVDLMAYLVRLVTPPKVIEIVCETCDNPPHDATTLPNVPRPADEQAPGDILLAGVSGQGPDAESPPVQGLRDGDQSSAPEVLFDGMSGDVASGGGQDASSPALPVVRKDLQAGEGRGSALLQSGLFGQGERDGPQETPDKDGGGLLAGSAPRSSDGVEGGLRDGTPPDRLGHDREAANAGRGRASSERGQGRQPARKLGTDDEAGTRQDAENAKKPGPRLPPLSGTDRPKQLCPHCGGGLTRRERPGLVLDPFAGSGTTGVGAMREGMRCVLIEREEAYVGDIMRKLAWAKGEGRLTTLEQARLDTPEKHAKAAGADLPLFGDA